MDSLHGLVFYDIFLQDDVKEDKLEQRKTIYNFI